MRYAARVLTVCFLGISLSSVSAELTPQHVAILANRRSPDSLAVARHYASQRGIPEAHIVQLSVDPQQDVISRQAYENDIVQPVRKAFAERDLAWKIRVLVTVYGIPLRVQAPVPNADEKRWVAEALERQNQTIQALEALATELHPEGAAAVPQSPPLPSAAEQVRTLSTRIQTAMEHMGTRLKAEKEPAKLAAETQQLTQAIVRFGGMTALLQQLQPSTAANAQTIQAERQRIQQRVNTALTIAQVLREEPSDINRQRAYRLVEFTHGLTGVFRHSEWELEMFLHKEGEASVDSELSLLWWDAQLYPEAKHVPNPLHHAMQSRSGHVSQGLPILMVSRLDAPTPQLARQLVERAITAEQQGLQGNVYVDARGMQAPSAAAGYASYDQDLRNMAAIFRRATPYNVVLEDTEQRFSQPGAAPQVAVYAGWYRLRNYEDAFSFNTGAIGFHLASGEAVSVHNPNERGWCKNALERGITATLGPVSEPYLEAFPLPSEFFGLLLTGRYTLVEAYYLTIKYLSWRLVLFGDPLYNPWKDRGVAPGEALVLQARQGSATTTLPAAPSQLPFADPRLAMQQLQQRRASVLANVNRLMEEFERHLREDGETEEEGKGGERERGREGERGR